MEFEKRGIRILAVSTDGVGRTKETDEEFPFVDFLSDANHTMGKALSLMGPLRKGEREAFSPTYMLIDREGVVRWLHRPERINYRLEVEEALAKIDELGLAAKKG